MVIKTKYNIGDKVKILPNLDTLAEEGIIISISIDKNGIFYTIRDEYQVDEYQEDEFVLLESKPQLESLIDSIQSPNLSRLASMIKSKKILDKKIEDTKKDLNLQPGDCLKTEEISVSCYEKTTYSYSSDTLTRLKKEISDEEAFLKLSNLAETKITNVITATIA